MKYPIAPLALMLAVQLSVADVQAHTRTLPWIKKTAAACAAIVTVAAATNILLHRVVDTSDLNSSGVTTRVRSRRDAMSFVSVIVSLLKKNLLDDPLMPNAAITQYVDYRELNQELGWLSERSPEELESTIVFVPDDGRKNGLLLVDGFIGIFSITEDETGWKLEIISSATGRPLYKGLLPKSQERTDLRP